MGTRARPSMQIFTGVAVMFVLLSSSLDGTLTAGIAAALFVAGLALYPATRRSAFWAALAALVVAVGVGLLLRSG
jgi:hypothetical protein